MLKAFFAKAFFLALTMWMTRFVFVLVTAEDSILFSLQKSELFKMLTLLLLTGFRFDLLVSCFLLAPLWILWTPFLYSFLSKNISSITKSYFFALLGFSTLYSLFSFSYLVKTQHHLRIPNNLNQLDDFLFSSSSILFFSAALILSALTFYMFWKFKKNFLEQIKPPHWKIWLLTGILLTLGARGTVSHHHLRREDCQVTSSAYLTEVCLNALWAADKPVFN